MFSKSLEQTLNKAFSRARAKRHEFITVEHLLLALLDNPEAMDALTACGAELDRLRAGLGIFIDETTPHVAGAAQMPREIHPTLSFQRVLQQAIDEVQNSGLPEVNGANVLCALFSESDSQAVYFLNQESVSRLDLVNYLTHGVNKHHSQSSSRLGNHEHNRGFEPNVGGELSTEEGLLENYTINLNQKVQSGRVDPLIGREAELERVIQVLSRRSKNNPLLVGEAGVGKTAIAEGLAQRIVAQEVPETLIGSTVYSLDLGILLAGTKYRGDFEKRFKTVLKALSRDSGAIVFIDEIHNLMGAGSATGSTMDAANLIKPLLSSGDLRCLGATTYDEFRNFIAKDQALLRRFQKIDVVEPTPEDTLHILEGLKTRFENYHHLEYTEEALKRAVELSSRYLTERHMPDKAIDVIDEAGAYQQLQPTPQRKKRITPSEIEQTVARMARVPVEQITSTDRQRLKNLGKQIRKSVFGQDRAIEALVNSILLARVGLRDINKPVGSFLLAGPTGVGKTEVTKQLAKELGIELIRIDMSEYMERHTVSRLIGAPPGYVGYDQGGLLTEAVNKHPHAILLLDEIEKAHPDLFNILLQVMDYGYLTDNNGHKTDFRHVMIIMTTNAGATNLERNPIGFVEPAERDDCLTEIKRLFSPEFRNRLDAVVSFDYLDHRTILRVVDKFLGELRAQLLEKNIQFSATPKAREWLAQAGYDRVMGARPMARIIQDKLKLPLANELLTGELSSGDGEVLVTVVDDEIRVKIRKKDLTFV